MAKSLAYTVKKNRLLEDEHVPVIEIRYNVFPEVKEENDSIKVSFSKENLITNIEDISDLHKLRKLFNLSNVGLKPSVKDSSNFYVSDYKFTTELVELYFKKLSESSIDVKTLKCNVNTDAEELAKQIVKYLNN